jgi:beta-lactamase regulating signal transducer with metallopeptidase domain
VASWYLVVNLVGHHLIPCVLASAVIYIALGLLFRLGRLRRPADRAAFLYVALLKAGLALWAGERISCLASHGRMNGYLGFSLPDLVSDGTAFELREPAAVPPVSALTGPMLLVIAVVVVLLLCYRWARLAPVYRAVYEGRSARPAEFPGTFRAFERLVTRACGRLRWLPQPELMIIREAGCVAFVMGGRSPVVVLSTGLVTKLGDHKVEGILAHELAHVRRLDHLGRWIATVFRDIMAWNPFVLLWYKRLVTEQEMACDEDAARLVGDPVVVASGLVEVAACSRLPQQVAVGLLTAWQAGGKRGTQRLGERIEHLAQTTDAPHRGSGRRAIAATVILGAFFAAQPHVTVSLPNLGLILTSLLG